jgi:hypothetical protein
MAAAAISARRRTSRRVVWPLPNLRHRQHKQLAVDQQEAQLYKVRLETVAGGCTSRIESVQMKFKSGSI